MTTAKFEKLANEYSLDLATANYGPGKMNVIYGFDSAQDVRDFADEHNLSILICKRKISTRETWKVHNTWNDVLDPVILDPLFNEASYWDDADKFWSWAIGGSVFDVESRDEFFKLFDLYKSIIKEIEDLEENQVLIVEDDGRTEVHNLLSAHCILGNVEFILGVYDDNRRDPEEVIISDIYDLADVVNMAGETGDYPHSIVEEAIDEHKWEDLQDCDNDICRDREGNLLTIGENGKAVVIEDKHHSK